MLFSDQQSSLANYYPPAIKVTSTDSHRLLLPPGPKPINGGTAGNRGACKLDPNDNRRNKPKGSAGICSQKIAEKKAKQGVVSTLDRCAKHAKINGQGQRHSQGQLHPHQRAAASNKSMILRDRDRNNTVRMLICVTLCFAACSFPRQLLNFLGYFGFRRHDPTDICFAVFVLFLNSALNPLIIVVFSRSIRAEIREFLVCFNNGRARNERNFLAMQSQQGSSRQHNRAASTRLVESRATGN